MQPVAQQPPPPPGMQPVIQQPPPYAPPPAQAMHGGPLDKQAVLAQAPFVLNRPDQPWVVTIEGDSIVARWKWMDAYFFSPQEVTDEVRDYTFTVTLSDKGTYKEHDRTEEKEKSIKMEGGKLSLGTSSNSFMGKTNRKSFEFGIGQDKQSGEVGLVGFKYNTTSVKQPIREYLTSCGWKQAGLFG